VSRLLRIILSTASILSLLLCLALSAVWVRSHWVADVLYWLDGVGVDDFSHAGSLVHYGCSVQSARGVVVVEALCQESWWVLVTLVAVTASSRITACQRPYRIMPSPFLGVGHTSGASPVSASRS
jgi:hypothetical protein